MSSGVYTGVESRPSLPHEGRAVRLTSRFAASWASFLCLPQLRRFPPSSRLKPAAFRRRRVIVALCTSFSTCVLHVDQSACACADGRGVWPVAWPAGTGGAEWRQSGRITIPIGAGCASPSLALDSAVGRCTRTLRAVCLWLMGCVSTLATNKHARPR